MKPREIGSERDVTCGVCMCLFLYECEMYIWVCVVVIRGEVESKVE